MTYLDTQDLKKYSIQTKNGEIGKVSDFYFDEDHFFVRYLVVDTKPFLIRNLVLVSPISFQDFNLDKHTIEVNCTKKELEDSPSIGFAETVSRQFEQAYHSYFSWPYYWQYSASPWALGPYGVTWENYDRVQKDPKEEIRRKKLEEEAESNSLRSAKEVTTYAIKGVDGTFGHIQGFILNTKTLGIEFVILDTINYLPSKLVLIRPSWVENISWHTRSVSIPFTKEEIKSAPRYSYEDLNHDFVEKTDKYFNRSLSAKEKQKTQRDDPFTQSSL